MRRLALIVSTISEGLSASLWRAFADGAPHDGDAAVLVLPHDFRQDGDFALFDRVAADGFVIAGNHISAYSQTSAADSFLERHSTLPFVTVGMRFCGHPSVGFESRKSTKEIVAHLIKIHGSRRIAFIRGPAWHKSAEERYMGYLDALAEAGLAVDERLITEPVEWEDGRLAMEQMIEKHSLKPAEDFDAVAAASDRLMLGASRALLALGCSIPEDVRMTGFNDGFESQMVIVPATTVRLPCEDMGLKAFSILENLIAGKDCQESEYIATPSLMIRASCGCMNSFGSEADAASSLSTPASFAAWAERVFRIGDGGREKLGSIIDEALSSTDLEGLWKHLAPLVEKYFLKDGELRLVNEAIVWFSLFLRPDEAFKAFSEDVLHTRLPIVLEKAYRRRLYENTRREEGLINLAKEMDRATSWKELGSVLSATLPQFGIRGCHLVTESADKALLAAGYLDGVVHESTVFEKTRLLPFPLESGTYIVKGNTSAYTVLYTEERNGVLLDRIGTLILSAMARIKALDIPALYCGEDTVLVSGLPSEAIAAVFPSSAVVDVGIGFSFSMIPGCGRIAAVVVSADSLDESLLATIRANSRLQSTVIIAIAHGLSAYHIRKNIACTNLLVLEDFMLSYPPLRERLQLLASGQRPLLKDSAGLFVRKAMEYMAANYQRDIPRWKIADALNVSEDYLARLFKLELGIRLWDYLILYRVGTADRLLRELDLSVNEASERCGFHSRAYFSRTYKRIFSIPPQEAASKA